MAIIKDFKIDKLRVRVFDSRNSMGACAGEEAAAYLRELLNEKDEINVMFAAAPSQNETLEMLCASSGIDWKRVNAFHMDEYVGLDPAHPAGFRNFLRRAILDRFPFKGLYLLDGNAADPLKAAGEYERVLRAHPLDACLMGVGENGHIAFNDPPVADFNDAKLVKVVELELSCREQQVHDGCFKRLEEVPTHALTATIPALMGAARLFCSVPAKTKAGAVRNMLEGEISTVCPASILRRHPAASLYLDTDSAEYILKGG
jgi:glucosamine-6-phosphate deaminase